MTNFTGTVPPYTKDGNFLSAYFINQLNDIVNSVGGAVYGANVPRWIEYSSDTLQPESNIYSLVHRFNTLSIKINFGNTDMLVKVYLTKDDGVLGTKIYEATTTSNGPLTLTFNLSTNPNGFSVNVGQLYFVRLYVSEVGTSSDFWSIEHIREINSGTIVKPTLPDITASTIIGQTYLNQLVDAARDLKSKIKVPSLPLVGWHFIGSAGRDNSHIRYKLRHLSRYLHYGMKSSIGGGADGLKLYINNVQLQSWDNDGSYYVGAFDMTALPNSIAEPAFGSEYELKFEIDRTSDFFELYYLWELPYI
jgi:hypothetical protein